MTDEPQPPADRPPSEAGIAKARNFADKVLMGHAERKFRSRAVELVALHQQATMEAAKLQVTLAELGARLDELTGEPRRAAGD